MRCLVCADPLSMSDSDHGHKICELCSPREHTKRTMERLWGPRCKSWDSDCVLCRAWKFFESKGKVPSTEDCL
jgi:hypothetical protein